ncbi:MAG: ribokinase [Anaerolineaceae bacterium]|nr:ribokinase [Anaerolineaceae bacterium]
MMKSIVVLGSINTDLILQCDHLPVPGETILSADLQNAGGGKGANQAVAMARLGADVAMVGMVGMDGYGDQHISAFKHEGMNTTYVYKLPKAPTGTAIILLDDQGQNSIVVSPGANMHLTQKEVTSANELFHAGAILVMQLEIPIRTVEFAAQLAKQRNMQIIFNPAPAQMLSDGLISMIDYLILNETEMEIISGQKMNNEGEAVQFAKKWIAQGVKGIILTLGAKGAWFVSVDEEFFMPPFHVEALDTTAAGDAFVGAFTKAIAEGLSHVEAMRFAAATAALAVTQLGAQPSLPTLKRVQTFLAQHPSG